MPKQSPPAEPDAAEPEAPRSDVPQPPQHRNRFFAWVRSLGLTRRPGWIGGVSAGIADRLGIDVLIVRGIFVVVAVLGGPAVLLYAAAWLVLPDSHDRIHLEDLFRGKIESPVIAIAVLGAIALLPVTQGFWWFGSLYWGAPQWGDSLGRAIWTLIILGLVAWLVVWFSRRTPGASVPTATTAPTATPATTDDRPTTIPDPAEPTPPPAPADDASAAQLADWRERQAQWKADHEAYRQQQAAQRNAVSQAAASAARAERVARAAAYREAHARTRSNPLYSAALVGLALVAGAIATLAFGDGAPGPIQFLAGVAIALGILGVGIIVNGALGRRSGGASGIAILLLAVLACAVIFPQSSAVRYVGDSTFTPHGERGSSQTYVEGVGDVTVDLTSYFSTARPKSAPSGWASSGVDVWVGVGNVTVIVPEGEYVSVHSDILRHSSASANHSYFVGTDRAWSHATRSINVDLSVGSGTVHIIKAPSEMGQDS